jgi:hypothetical protein
MAICLMCGNEFEAKRKDARLCGVKCRARAARRIKKVARDGEKSPLSEREQKRVANIKLESLEAAKQFALIQQMYGNGAARLALKLVAALEDVWSNEMQGLMDDQQNYVRELRSIIHSLR